MSCCEKQEIAVILGEDGRTVPLSRGGRVTVFGRDVGQWTKKREMDFVVDPDKGLATMRETFADLIRFLDKCHIFVASSATGALFFELEKAKFSVWEIQGEPSSFLEQVWTDDDADHDEGPQTFEVPVPVQRAPGDYYISIKEIQGKRPDLSSKRLLQSFIRKGDFQTLEIICDHVPPWIELESNTVGFRMESEKEDGGRVLLKLVKVSP